MVQFLLRDKLLERKTHHLKHEKAAQVPQPDLKLGARFRLTQLGAERCPKFCGDTGTVVGFARNSGGIRVLLDGTKRPRSLHRSYIRPVDHDDRAEPASNSFFSQGPATK